MTAERRRQNSQLSTPEVNEKITNLYKNAIDTVVAPPSLTAAAAILEGEIGVILRPMKIYEVLKRRGLQPEIKELRRKLKEMPVNLEPSQNAAWFLGVVFGGGQVSTDPPRISLTSSNERIRDTFKNIGERILKKKNGESVHAQQKKLGKNVNESVVFNSKEHVEAFGSFKNTDKLTTLKKRFNWVRDEQYTVSFLSGVFDSSDRQFTASDKVILLYSVDLKVLRFYKDLLREIGIKSINTVRIDGRDVAVRIRRIADLHIFGEVIKSVDPDRQGQLQSLKTLEKKIQHREIPPPPKKYQEDEIFAEWKRLRISFGRPPSIREIRQLYRMEPKMTLFDGGVYMRYFGLNEEGKLSFPLARERLEERVVAEDAMNPKENPIFP